MMSDPGTGRFRTHADEFTIGQRVEVMVSTDPVELRTGIVTGLDGSVSVRFDDGSAGCYRPFAVRDVPVIAGQLELYGLANGGRP